MAKPDPVFSHYFKARFRPFMQPKLWASAGIFCLSAYVLVRMFVQPDSFLGTAEDQRTGAANLQADANLSPEEQAIAAELDDIAVLLEALDDEGTIELAVADDSLAEAQQQASKKGNKLPKVELDSPQIDIPDADYGRFNSLPLLDFNPIPSNRQTATLGQSRGFVGFNSVSSDPALNLPTLSTSLDRPENQTNSLSPLQQALNLYAPGVSGGSAVQGITTSSNSSAAQTAAQTSVGLTPGSQTLGNPTLVGQPGNTNSLNGNTLNGNILNGSATDDSLTGVNTANTNVPGLNPSTATSLTSATDGGATSLTPNSPQTQNTLTPPLPNAFTQLQNPQFSVPTTPQTANPSANPSAPAVSVPTVPTVPSLQAPVTTAPAAQPRFDAAPTASTGQFSGSQQQFSGNANGRSSQTFTNPAVNSSAPGNPALTNPAVTNSPVFPQAPGTPVYQQPAQAAPSSFSVPSRPPGQNIGGGQINTFSNP